MKLLAGAAGAVTLGAILILYSESLILTILGYIAGIMGLLMVILPIFIGFGGRASCPLCSSEVEVTFGKEAYVLCKSCGEYLEAADKKLWQMDIVHIANEPQFAAPTPWNDLRLATAPTVTLPSSGPPVDPSLLDRRGQDRILDAKWPKGCCVCGKVAIRKETITQVVIKPPEKIGRVRGEQITLVVRNIPHCDEHTGGVKFGRIPSLEGWYLMFRSYAYRNKFREKNPWEWPWTKT